MKRVILVTSVIALDQILKYFAHQDLLPSLGGLFRPIVCNPNLSWGIPVHGPVLGIVWLLVATAFFILLKRSNWNNFLVLAFGGALSNAIDRTKHGCVIDFIGVANFPIFNFADMCIVGGIMLFLISIHLKSKQEKGSAS